MLLKLVKEIYYTYENYCLLFLLCFSTFGYSQETDEDVVRKTIDDFFVGFHQKDGVKMQDAVTKDVIMQTIAKYKQGSINVKTEMFDDFVNNIIYSTGCCF